jgi:hypothetical protein
MSFGIPGVSGTGHSLQGGDATALTGDQHAHARLDHAGTLDLGDFGNIFNEGITINESFKFDSKSPVHVGGAIIIGIVLLTYFSKGLKSWFGKR